MTDDPASPLAPPLPEKKYYAFVSYSSKDKRWGRWLHSRLENYVIPQKVRALAAKQGRELPKRLRPCFRDRDELAGAADLGEKIGKALRDTRYLVVLCSKRSARSEWVNKEIQDFRALAPGNKDRILALILDGVPNATSDPAVDDAEECFPPALRTPIEPLAGDLRPEGDGRERGFIKILAGLTGMDFDQFYRRHERREQQIRAVWTTVAVTLILGFAGLTAFALLQQQEAIRQRDVAVTRAETIKENVEWMNFQLRDILSKYAPSEVAVEANERIDTMLRAVETGAGKGMAKTSLEIQWDRVRGALGLQPEVAQRDLEVLRARMTANLQKADAIVANADGNPAEARELYHEALRLAVALTRLEQDNLGLKRELGVTYNRLGDLELKLGDTAKALGFYNKAQEVVEELVKRDPANTDFRGDGVVSLIKQGDLQLKTGNSRKAVALYDQALGEAMGLAKLNPAKTQCRRDAGILCNRLGEIHLQLEDTAKALGFYEKALAERVDLLKLDPANTQFRRDLAVSYDNLGSVHLRLNHVEQAKELFGKALAIFEELIILDPDNVEFRRDVSVSASGLGDLHRQLGDTTTALELYRKDLAMAEALVKLDPANTEFRRDVSVSVGKLGELQMQLGDTAQANVFYDKCLAISEDLARRYPGVTQFQRDVGLCCERQGDLYLEKEAMPQALGFYEKALAVREKLVKLDPANTEFRRDVAVSHAKLGQLREAQGAEGRRAALAHYRKFVEIFEGMKAAGVLAPADEGFIAQFREKVAELE